MQMSYLYASDFLSKTFANSLNMQKQYVKIVWEKTYDAYSLSIRVQTTITIFRVFRFYVFYHNINVKAFFFSERELKKALRDSVVGT